MSYVESLKRNKTGYYNSISWNSFGRMLYNGTKYNVHHLNGDIYETEDICDRADMEERGQRTSVP